MDDWLVRDPEEFVASLGLNKQQLEVSGGRDAKGATTTKSLHTLDDEGSDL